MTMNALEVGQRADALVQLMQSDAAPEQAHAIMAGVSAEDVEAILVAFRWQGWARENIPVPERGQRILDLIARLPDDP